MSTFKKLSTIFYNEKLTYFSILKAQSFAYLSDCLLSVRPTLGGFCESRLPYRMNPHLTLEGLQSIVCVLFPYTPASPAMTPAPIPPENIGYINSGDLFLGADYHRVFLEKLRRVCTSLTTAFGGESQAFCDTGPLVDKEVAVASGLCAYGKNTLACQSDLGSHFYIGYILTTVALPPTAAPVQSPALFSGCADCTACVEACPGRALPGDATLQHPHCISYISQKKGLLTMQELSALGNTLYGCTICQSVCPANRAQGAYRLGVDAVAALSLSGRQLRTQFGNTAAGWLGKTTLQRNCLAALQHNRHPDRRDIFLRFAKAPNEILSETAKQLLLLD